MMQAFPECYLSDAMRNMGEYMEYGYEAAAVEPDVCVSFLVISGYASAWENGDPRVLSGMSGTELFQRAAERCGFQADEREALVRYDTEAYYWSGYMLAYYQWMTMEHFSTIAQDLRISDLTRLYPALHTASEEKALASISELIRKRRMISRLQAYRKGLGLSQRELAALAGVNLRTLQQYEIGDKDIRRASAEKVVALSRVLCCKPEELLA